MAMGSQRKTRKPLSRKQVQLRTEVQQEADHKHCLQIPVILSLGGKYFRT